MISHELVCNLGLNPIRRLSYQSAPNRVYFHGSLQPILQAHHIPCLPILAKKTIPNAGGQASVSPRDFNGDYHFSPVDEALVEAVTPPLVYSPCAYRQLSTPLTSLYINLLSNTHKSSPPPLQQHHHLNIQNLNHFINPHNLNNGLRRAFRNFPL